MDNLVSLRNVFKKYKSSNNWVLNDISLDIPKDSITFVCGPSGVGKSTLLHIIGLMDKPDKGDVIFDGIQTNNFNSTLNFEKLRLTSVGFMFQHHYLIENLTVKENIILPYWAKNDNGNVSFKINNYIQEYLEILGINNLLMRYPYELSGGEQQRIALARAIVNKPKLVVADEPTGNLDQENAEKVMILIKNLKTQYRITFVIATHNTLLTEYGDLKINLKDGKILI